MTLTHALLACIGSFAAGGVCGAIYWNRVKVKAAAELVSIQKKL